MGLRTLFCLLVLAFLVPDDLTATTAAPGGTCGTDPCVLDCTNCAMNEMVADPEDCHRFYLCDGMGINYPFILECDTGEVFDATQHKCVPGDSCEPCDLPSSCVYECGVFEDGTSPKVIPSRYSCDTYFTCDEENVINGQEHCGSENQFFDGVKCQTDEKRCCHCHPYCMSTITPPSQTADPMDCRRYYLCTEATVVPTLSGTCEEGQCFDSNANECSFLAPCFTQCTNVVDSDGCIDPFTCLEAGYFARCPLAEKCTPDYYHCTEADGTVQEAESCTDGTVFHPSSHNCVSGDNCP